MVVVNDNYRRLSGADKAAIFMLSLGAESSTLILDLMADQEIRDLSHTMANLGTIDASIVEQLFLEFADQLSSTGSLMGTHDSTERLLLSSMDKDKVDLIMNEIRGPEGRTMWDKLGNVGEEVLANFLKNEYPQTVAVVLSKLKSEHAARVISLLPDSFAMEVMMRLLRMDTVHKDILKGIEGTLRTEFMSNLDPMQRRDSYEQIADIFNSLDRTTENRFMGALEERNQEGAEKIKNLMFTFEDLTRINPSGIQVLLRQLEKDQLALALKGGSDKIRNLFFKNMSERAARMMQEDMEAMGAVRIKEVEDAQNTVVNSAKTLADSGEIVIAGGREDDELVF